MQSILNEDSIVFDEPHKRYLPGDSVSGYIFFNTPSSIRARHLKVTCEGVARTGWRNNEKRAEMKLFSEERTVWRALGKEKHIPAGENYYAFKFVLPKTSSPSFVGEFGSVEYQVKVSLSRWWWFNANASKPIIVAGKACIPRSLALSLKRFDFHDTVHFETGGCLNIYGHIPLRFYALDSFPLVITVENRSPKNIPSLDFYMSRLSHYHARAQDHLCDSAERCRLDRDEKERLNVKHSSKAIVHVELELNILAMGRLTKQFEVPCRRGGIVAPFNNSLISMRYMMHVAIPRVFDLYPISGEIGKDEPEEDA
ncbi:unnamed protein product [Caenorhabditis sp. 36 PRJEB53466]|nr:unnamed protein product [Caenorhabditis sp. 36 PRJEB53466]